MIKEGGIMLFLHYHWLLIRKFLGYKTFRVKSFNICTTKSIIREGGEYQYNEGNQLDRVVIKGICFKEFSIYLKVQPIGEGKGFICFHTLIPFEYVGMWKIFDKGRYAI